MEIRPIRTDEDHRVYPDLAEDGPHAVASEVGGERDARRPSGAAERVPEKEGAPVH